MSTPRLSSVPGSRYNQPSRWSPGRAFANPSIVTRLTLVKVVSNTHGGTALPSAWTLTASGPTPLTGPGTVTGTVDPGTYVLGESSGPSGYTAGVWVCVGGTQVGSQVTIAEGETVVCTIINTDQSVVPPPPTPPTPNPPDCTDDPVAPVTYHASGAGSITTGQIAPTVRQYVSGEPKEPRQP
jgi:hypothetical protein